MSSSGRVSTSAAAGDLVAGANTEAVTLYAQGSSTPAYNRLSTPTQLGDGNDGAHALGVGAFLYNGAFWDKPRTPNKFKAASITAAGDNALWTPAAGKKFRLMGFAMLIAGDSAIAVAGEQVILLRDAAVDTGVVRFNPFIPNAAPNLIQGGASIQPLQLGNGYLSTTANNVLNVNLSVAFTAGNVDVMAWGTEE